MISEFYVTMGEPVNWAESISIVNITPGTCRQQRMNDAIGCPSNSDMPRSGIVAMDNGCDATFLIDIRSGLFLRTNKSKGVKRGVQSKSSRYLAYSDSRQGTME